LAVNEMSKIPVTVNGAEKLRAELHNLKTVERPRAIAAIAEARSHGDLSENAEYDAAKERQGFVEGRIKEIESKLANAQIIDPKLQTRQCTDHRPEATRRRRALRFRGNARSRGSGNWPWRQLSDCWRYQIVGEDEADIKAGKISINSPIARALIGKFAGDIAEVQAPGGVREYEIIEVRYE